MSISREAVEAAAKEIAGLSLYKSPTAVAKAALTAALPHLLAAKDAEIAAFEERKSKVLEMVSDITSERDRLKKSLLDATAHLCSATSAYEKFVGRHNRRGCKDALFETRFADFTKACSRARAALEMSGGVKP